MYITKACHILDAAGRDNSLRRSFDRDYRLYSRIISMVFFLNTVYPVGIKLFQDRLAGDRLHSVLHLASGLFGAYAGWYAGSVIPARLYVWGIGIAYVGLAFYGWSSSGLLLGTSFAIPLGVADNIFHLLLGVPALGIAAVDLLRSFLSRDPSADRA